MKIKIFLILVCFQSLVFSQQKIENLTSLTLHKVYNIPDDANGNGFIDTQYSSIANAKISKCDTLVLKLISLKSSLKNCKSNSLCSDVYSRGCGVIKYMVTYQFNALIDTLYFDDNGPSIIDYSKHKEYRDNENQFLKIISKNKVLYELYLANLDSLHREMFSNQVIDSVDVNEVKIRGKSIYRQKLEQIDKDIDSSFHFYKKEYYRGYDTNGEWKLDSDVEYRSYMNYFYFTDTNLIHRIILQDPTYGIDKKEIAKSRLEILGLKVGDDEKLVVNKFPNSTQQIQNQKKYFKEENGDYTINVSIENHKGNIEYYFNNEKIIKIIVSFYY